MDDAAYALLVRVPDPVLSGGHSSQALLGQFSRAPKRIAILANQHTKSAAEMVTDFAKTHHLATIVGTRTAGEVLGAVNFLVGEEYRLRLAIGGWMTWDERLLECRGVQPDVAVAPTVGDLRAGRDPVLSESLDLLAG